ncbi:MAG: ribulose-phosphate 3-epimerase [Acetobacteraceae bacterium]|nr:ribulose-phosphate 3-epimerase [Acetobacteraceae bacterium]
MPTAAPPRSIVAASLLAADFTRLGEEVRAVDAAGNDWLHLDVMDGHFVPNISFGPAVIRAIRKLSNAPFDVHLMIAPVDPYIDAFCEAGADHIIVHAEAGPHLHRTLQQIRARGRKPGVALNPATPPDAAMWVLDYVDSVLVMTVNPGFGGQSFLDSQLPKIAALRRAIDASGRQIALEVDGGISATTAGRCRAAGANVFVAGTAVFDAADYAAAIAALRADAA